jgi:hypothetical protein
MLKMKSFLSTILILSLIVSSGEAAAQTSIPFTIQLEPVIIPEFEGLQSYAWAKDGDKILLAGGRTDGLHRRQPFAAFSKNFAATELIVLDIKQEKVWKTNLSALSLPISEQLRSSNMESVQQGNQLFIVGGYGYSESKRNHITYPSLIIIQVKELIDAIINKRPVTPFIQQVTDERMAVTGGRLNLLDGQFYLVGGQRFDGRYNPHGPDHGPGFFQEYTNQIRRFDIENSNGNWHIKNYTAITDSLLLHRRDYNLLLQLDSNRKEMLTIFSGVFQYGKDVPFTTLVDINNEGHAEVPGFNQLFNHYHTANMALYSEQKKTMYAVFFGGIAQQYRDSTGKNVTDNSIPFVKTISVVERKGSKTNEYALPNELSGYFGAAAEFIPRVTNLFSENGILSFDKLTKKPLLVGYIPGGIDSRAPSVFWSNEANPSRASPVIWKVYIQRNQ